MKKFFRVLGIAFIVLFLSALVGVSVLLLSKNEYGIVEMGDSLLLNITEDNESSVYEAGSLVVLQKVKTEDLQVGQEIFVYEQSDNLNSVFVVSVKITNINEEDKYVTTDRDSKNWSYDYIAGTSKKVIPNLGAYFNVVTSKWFVFGVFLVPTFFILIYEIYSIVVSIKYDDEVIPEDTPTSGSSPEEQELAKLRQELEALKQQALEKTGKLPVTSLDLPKEQEPVPEEAPKEEETPEGIELPKEPTIADEISSLTVDNKTAETYTPEAIQSDGPVSKDMIQNAIDEFMVQNGIIALDEKPKEEAEAVDLPKMADGTDAWEDIEDDVITDVNQVEETPEEQAEEEAEETANQEPVELGKTESNVLKKGILLLENEVKELLNLLVNADKKKTGYHKPIETFAKYYIEDKYYGDTYLIGDMHYKNSLIDAYRFEDIPSNSKKFVELSNDLKCINTILYRPTKKGIEDAITRYKKSLNEEQHNKLKEEIEATLKRYADLEKDFFHKVANKSFELIQEPIQGAEFMITYVKVNIQFDKIFSEYAIDKSYQNKVIAENLDEMQLKMIGFQLFENIIKNKNSKTHYLFHFSESMFEKPRKITTLLNEMSDPYQEEKIIITLTKETLSKQLDFVKEYRKNGYNFGICLELKDLNSKLNKKELVYADYIFIYDEENKGVTEGQLDEFLPINLKDKTYISNIPVLHEEAHK